MLDDRLAGRSLRLIAIDLNGAGKVAEEWCSDSPMRARVRWRVKIAVALMQGGYREMVADA